MDMVPFQRGLRFSAATGGGSSPVTSSSGHVATAEEYARKVQVAYNPDGSLSSVHSWAQADAKTFRKQQPCPGVVVRSRECFCLP